MATFYSKPLDRYTYLIDNVERIKDLDNLITKIPVLKTVTIQILDKLHEDSYNYNLERMGIKCLDDDEIFLFWSLFNFEISVFMTDNHLYVDITTKGNENGQWYHTRRLTLLPTDLSTNDNMLAIALEHLKNGFEKVKIPQLM